MTESAILKLQNKTLDLLADKIDDFYLTGGTALSRYYFQHRFSDDLDFFAQKYDRTRIQETIDYLSIKLKKEIKLTAEQTEKTGRVKMAVYYIPQRESGLKIDFIEDYLKLLEPLRKIDGIFVISLSDIYLRKIYTLIGNVESTDAVGRRISSGRQEAKDYYDLYFLSHTFKRLSDFSLEYCRSTEREALIHWYRTYDRMNIKTGLLDLKLTSKKPLDVRKMDEHFKNEIDRLLEREIGKI